MKRVEIIARGDVQRVGYRDVVQRIGRNLGISGTVQNQEPYDVRVMAEGEEEALKELVEALRIEDGPIQVRELEVRWSEATGEFPYFKIIRGDWQEELGERFDVAVGLLHQSIVLGEENLAVSRMMLNKQDQMLDKQDQMLDKQDASISILQEIKADTSEIGAIREEVSATRDEARHGREEIISTLKSDSLEEKYERLSQEIAEIKAAIAEIRAKVS